MYNVVPHSFYFLYYKPSVRETIKSFLYTEPQSNKRWTPFSTGTTNPHSEQRSTSLSTINTTISTPATAIQMILTVAKNKKKQNKTKTKNKKINWNVLNLYKKSDQSNNFWESYGPLKYGYKWSFISFSWITPNYWRLNTTQKKCLGITFICAHHIWSKLIEN